jgi:transposase
MRYELTDYEWAAIKPFLPNKPRGVPRVNDRRVLNGIFWVLRSGAPWRDLPENFGPYPDVPAIERSRHDLALMYPNPGAMKRNKKS